MAAAVIGLLVRAGGDAIRLARAFAVFLERPHVVGGLVKGRRQRVGEPADVFVGEQALPDVEEVVHAVDLASGRGRH